MEETSKGKGPLQCSYSSSIGSGGKLDATVHPSRRNLGSKTDLDKLVTYAKRMLKSCKACDLYMVGKQRHQTLKLKYIKQRYYKQRRLLLSYNHTNMQEQERKRSERQCLTELGKQLLEPHVEISTRIQRRQRASNFDGQMSPIPLISFACFSPQRQEKNKCCHRNFVPTEPGTPTVEPSPTQRRSSTLERDQEHSV